MKQIHERIQWKLDEWRTIHLGEPEMLRLAPDYVGQFEKECDKYSRMTGPPYPVPPYKRFFLLGIELIPDPRIEKGIVVITNRANECLGAFLFE